MWFRQQFLVLCGPAYRPTEEIDLRSIGWGNIFQLPFKHLRDYRLRLLCPFFIYSGLEVLFAITGFSLVLHPYTYRWQSFGLSVVWVQNVWEFTGISISCPLQSYGVCILGLKKLWLLIVVYGLSSSVFSSLSLFLLRLPRWLCLLGGAAVHAVLIIALLVFSSKPDQPEYLGPLLVISVLWGLGTALNKTGVSSEYHLTSRRRQQCWGNTF